MAKYSHKSVNYGPGHKDAHCSICEHFIAKGPHCGIVADPIKPTGWCEKFEDHPQRAVERKLNAKDKY